MTPELAMEWLRVVAVAGLLAGMFGAFAIALVYAAMCAWKEGRTDG
jgi:hypothetical protein